MEESNDLIFVYGDDRQDSTTYAIVATLLIVPHIPAGSNSPPRSIYVMSDNPFAITWDYYLENRMISYAPSFDDSHLVRTTIQKEHQIVLRPFQSLPPTPFYLSGNKERRPTTYMVIVRFVFDTVDFLLNVLSALAGNGWIDSPSEEDVESALKEREQALKSLEEQIAQEDAQRGWFAGWFHRLCHAASERRDADYDYYKNFLALAHSTEPFPGLYLPVFLTGIEPPGVLQIIEAQGQRTFIATLYLSDTLGDVQMPIELVSKDRQLQGDQFHVVEKVIGSIVEVIPMEERTVSQ